MNFTNFTTLMPENTTGIYGNETNNTLHHPGDFADTSVYAVLVPLVWGILTFVGALGNAVVIYTLILHGDKNATNYFVINLAISDLAFVVIVIPFTATQYALPSWIFGDAMCKLVTYMIYATLHATCLTLMAMTIDRYCAIVYAVQSRNWRTTTKSMVVCLVVWLVSALISLPFAIYFETMDFHGVIVCKDVWPEPEDMYGKLMTLTVVFSSYIIPLSVIVFCYAMILNTLWKNKMATGQHSNGITSKKTQQQEKRRKRVTKLVASVVIVFATFWLPIHIINICLKFNPSIPKTVELYNFKIFAHTLSYANSCVNPFVYAFLSDGFRKSFRKTFPSLAQRYRICGGPADECVSQICMEDKMEQTTKTSALEERKLMQTDL